jgi:hypothetical protein
MALDAASMRLRCGFDAVSDAVSDATSVRNRCAVDAVLDAVSDVELDATSNPA